MNEMTEDNCRIGYSKSQAWILKVLLNSLLGQICLFIVCINKAKAPILIMNYYCILSPEDAAAISCIYPFMLMADGNSVICYIVRREMEIA